MKRTKAPDGTYEWRECQHPQRKQRRVRHVVDRWGHVWPAEATVAGWSGPAA